MFFGKSAGVVEAQGGREDAAEADGERAARQADDHRVAVGEPGRPGGDAPLHQGRRHRAEPRGQ